MSKSVSYKRHRFPPEIIAHALLLYFRFPLSLRRVERGIVLSYETVRRWALKLGPTYARRLRCKMPSPRDIWHLDEVVVTISGNKHWLWCQAIAEMLAKEAGLPPRRMITDKLGSYAAARRQIMPEVEHRSHKGLNNRAVNSNLPFRRRERAMQGFRSPRYLQRFVSVFSAVRNLFVPPRSSRSAPASYLHRLNAMAEWKAMANIAA